MPSFFFPDKVVGEIVKNRSLYDASDLLKFGADSFEELMLDSMRNETYSSLHHMYALVNVVYCNVRSVYPESKIPLSNEMTKRTDFFSGKNWKHGVDIMVTQKTIGSQIILFFWSLNDSFM